ncbi:MAG TPA: hypothetical protein VGL72_19325 [Bryobacteraceae bacterium]|jgi:uncharacterized protein YpuA (DUF1002 family)
MDDCKAPRPGTASIDAALAGFLESLEEGGVKLSVSDALRLLELRKQLAQEEIREVKVKWVEPRLAPFVIKI